MSTNYDILNYLNLINPRFGKLYKLTGYNPLPNDFVLDNEKIKDCLYLYQMKNGIKFPEFVFSDKKTVKRNFKNSENNIKKIRKIIISSDFAPEFLENLRIYLDLRLKLTKMILKEFRDQRFDECDAYEEIYNLNPVLGNLLENLYEDSVDISKLLNGLEDKYKISYLEKLQIIERQKQKSSNKTTGSLSAKILSENKHEKTVTENNKKIKNIENSDKIADISEHNSKTFKEKQ